MNRARLTPRARARLRADLCGGRAADAAFDALYPASIRVPSRWFWTPVAVAARAAQLLASHGVHRVLDVGSGAGKFCLVAASVHPTIDFTGVEQRPHLVEAATAAGKHLGLGNVRFSVGDATSVPWLDFDGLYLFNPFAENNCDEDEHLDQTVELSSRRFMADVGRVVVALVSASVGLCMATYHGFGGPIPASWKLVHAEPARSDWLRVWVKHRPGGDLRVFYVEDGDDVVLVDNASGRTEKIAQPSCGGAPPARSEL